MFGKVAVLMGGVSAERAISLQSGAAVLGSLRRQGIDAHGVDTQDRCINQLLDNKYDRAFIALHGRCGEDGAIQGLLENLGIPYTGSGVLGSALCMDKCVSKKLLQAHGLATPPFTKISPDTNMGHLVELLGLPLCIKPIYEGSSVGVCKVTSAVDIDAALLNAGKYGEVMCEQWITGDEYTVGILDGKVLPAIQVSGTNSFYDYEAKYLADDTKYICPCDDLLSPAEMKLLNHLALKAYKVLHASGWARVDLMRDLSGDFWILEVNTVPGLTQDHSLVPMAASVEGISFDQLVVKILELSVEREKQDKKIQRLV